jgi:hypothetical protein
MNFNLVNHDPDDAFDSAFLGTPQSKYWDILTQSSDEVSKEELDKVFEKFAAMELMLNSIKGEDFDIESELKNYIFENSVSVEEKKQGLYIEFTGDIVCRLDS